jgi:uncharacterized RDD family membrane protein YckC
LARDHPSHLRRLSAALIDGSLYLSLLFLVVLGVDKQWRIATPLITLVDVVYNIFLVYRLDGTPGKLMLGLSIQNLDGSSISLWGAIKRHMGIGVLGMLLALPFWVLSAISGNKELFLVGNAIAGFLPVIDPMAILFNEDRRALHDHVAGTVVVTD